MAHENSQEKSDKQEEMPIVFVLNVTSDNCKVFLDANWGAGSHVILVTTLPQDSIS